MALMDNIVLDDATTPTPVSHTFKPMSNASNLSVWQDPAQTALIDRATISASVRPAAKDNGGHKVIWKITLPHPVTDDGCCIPPGTQPPQSIATIEILHSKDATDAQFADLLAYLQGLVVDSQFVATANGESVRG